MACWLITVDTYLLRPSGTPNHTIPTVQKGDIFLCRNLLSEWAFELCSDAESIPTPAKNNYNLKQCFDFHLHIRINFNLWLVAYFETTLSRLYLTKFDNQEQGGWYVLCIVWWDLQMMQEKHLKQMAAGRRDTHPFVNADSVQYCFPYQINLKQTHHNKSGTSKVSLRYTTG